MRTLLRWTLLVSLALAALAAAPTTASATTITPAGTFVASGTLGFDADDDPFTTFFEMSCSTQLSGTINEDGTGQIDSVTLSFCSGGCTVDGVNNLPWDFTVAHIVSTTFDATLTLEFNVTVTCGFTITCTFTDPFAGDVVDGSPGQIYGPFVIEGGGCGATWTGFLTIDAPNPITITA